MDDLQAFLKQHPNVELCLNSRGMKIGHRHTHSQGWLRAGWQTKPETLIEQYRRQTGDRVTKSGGNVARSSIQHICDTFSLDDLKDYANAIGVSSQGDKATICKRLIDTYTREMGEYWK